jgi:hypothetical protein
MRNERRSVGDVSGSGPERVQFFVDLETGVWHALASGDPEADRALLSSDFLGVYPTGFADREEHAGQLGDGPTVASFEIRDPRLREITSGHVLLSYEAAYRRSATEPVRVMYISSLWSLRDDGWINVFSQDTPAD